jgi:hypothetical protein
MESLENHAVASLENHALASLEKSCRGINGELDMASPM